MAQRKGLMSPILLRTLLPSGLASKDILPDQSLGCMKGWNRGSRQPCHHQELRQMWEVDPNASGEQQAAWLSAHKQALRNHSAAGKEYHITRRYGDSATPPTYMKSSFRSFISLENMVGGPVCARHSPGTTHILYTCESPATRHIRTVVGEKGG